MKIFSVLLVVRLLLGGLALLPVGAAEPPPNILLVLSDDHSVPHLGCYGSPNAITPHLDAFAALEDLGTRGERFDVIILDPPAFIKRKKDLKEGERAYRKINRDAFALAAAYCHGIARNHPFVDGNKRVAFLAMYVFLGINGVRIEAQEPDVVALMLGVASGELPENELAVWLRTHTAAR